MPALGNALGLPYGRLGRSFIGPMDAYAARLQRCWCPGKRLLGSWAGSSSILRETTGSTEQTFGYLNTGYLNTTSIASFLSGAGASAAAYKLIYDQNNSGDDLTQTTAINQPLYLASHSGFNSRPCLHLDSILKGMPSTLDIATPYTILVVEDDDASGLSQRAITAYTGTGTFENNLICAGRLNLSAFRQGTVSTTRELAPCVEILTAPASGTHNFYCNGTNVTTGSPAATGNWRKLCVGRAPSPGGTEGAITKIFAVLVFNDALTTGDVAAMQTIFAPASL
jgi:hypothetical protein